MVYLARTVASLYLGHKPFLVFGSLRAEWSPCSLLMRFVWKLKTLFHGPELFTIEERGALKPECGMIKHYYSMYSENEGREAGLIIE